MSTVKKAWERFVSTYFDGDVAATFERFSQLAETGVGALRSYSPRSCDVVGLLLQGVSLKQALDMQQHWTGGFPPPHKAEKTKRRRRIVRKARVVKKRRRKA